MAKVNLSKNVPVNLVHRPRRAAARQKMFGKPPAVSKARSAAQAERSEMRNPHRLLNPTQFGTTDWDAIGKSAAQRMIRTDKEQTAAATDPYRSVGGLNKEQN